MFFLLVHHTTRLQCSIVYLGVVSQISSWHSYTRNSDGAVFAAVPLHPSQILCASDHDAPYTPCRATMRRKRSSSLPCFVTASGPSPSPVRRRHVLYAVLCIAFLLWCFRTPGSATDNVDWSQYAYSLYATDGTTLCHALLIFDALSRVGSKADRVLFYPKAMDTVVSHSADRDSQLLVMARDKYGVRLVPNTMLKVEGRVEGL